LTCANTTRHFNWNNPSERELKAFGLLLPAFGVVAGTSIWWQSGSVTAAVAVAIVAASIALVFFLVPRWQTSIYVRWMYGASAIGSVVSLVFMALIYFLVIAPIGLAVRWLRGDPLARRFEPAAKTYWRPRSPRVDRNDYLRQF
jgi:hypothetical protein